MSPLVGEEDRPGCGPPRSSSYRRPISLSSPSFSPAWAPWVGEGAELASHGEEEEDEVRLGGDLGFLRLGRSNGYSSQEPWLIRHTTRRVVALPLRPAQGSRRRSVRHASSCWIQDERWRSARTVTFTKTKKTRGARASAMHGPDGWDETVKT